jgi:DNA segregation ATPase FtsK/SpoIIIE, S-DNA-T family
MSEKKRNRIQFNEPEKEDFLIEEQVIPSKKSKSQPKVSQKTSERKIEKPKNNKEEVSFLKTVLTYLKSSQFKRLLGLSLMFLGTYASIAIISYFFTWQEDQDKILAPSDVFYSNEVKVTNWLGKFGAILSHWMVYKTFGITSILLSVLTLLLGVSWFFLNGKSSWFNKLLSKSVFFLVWLPLLFGFLFKDNLLLLPGSYGYFVSEYLQSLVGKIGLGLVIGVSLLTYFIIAYNFSFNFTWKSDNTQANENEKEELMSQDNIESNEYSAIPVYLDPEHPLSEEEKEAMLNFELKTIDKEMPAASLQDKISAFVNAEGLLAEETIIPENNTIEDPDVSEFESAAQYGEKDILPKNNDVEFQVEAPVEELHLDADDIDAKARDLVHEFGEYDSTLDLSQYQAPTIDLLYDYPSKENGVNTEELTANKNRIVDTLKNYGIEIDKIKATIGPTVTLYEIVPAAGVRISKIKNLEDDIALSLSALGIRIIAPIPGKGTIGIEVPNQHPEMVPMKNIFNSEKFINTSFDLPIALGKTISNETFIADLAKMPHLLMAGATGQGKSVGLNAILVSLLYKKHPSQIKFVLVDPKKVELTLFNRIERHFLAKLPDSEESIITDTKKVVHTLNSLCIEMDNRYELLKDAQVRNIKEYNAKFVSRKLNPNEGHKYLPYIVLVVDEFADLIMTAGKEVETPIARLAQLARAIGIHLIIATQRPSVNIITGTIKANFPARIAFRVTSKIDSRTILDTGGAEQLIGRGDMLLSTGNDLTRIQCAFVDTPEVEKITDFIGSQRAYPTAFMLPEYIDENAEQEKDIDLSDRDKMFDEAAKIIVMHQQGSASLLQRKLKLGYNRAGRIVDQLESAGILGKFEGSKPREVLVKDIVSLEEILNNLNNNS